MQGFAIVEGVCTPEECKELEALWARAVGSAVEHAMVDPLTLPLGAIPGQHRAGFTPGLGLPHSEFSWRVRLHPMVRAVFAGIFDEPPESLVVGQDLVVRGQ